MVGWQKPEGNSSGIIKFGAKVKIFYNPAKIINNICNIIALAIL